MSTVDWKPSPALARAVQSALLTFKRHHPRIFALVGDDSEAGQAFLADYARAFLGRSVSLEIIPDAAQRWVAAKDEAPRPASFVMWCRQIDQEVNPQVTSYTPAAAPIATSKNPVEIDKRSKYMRQEFDRLKLERMPDTKLSESSVVLMSKCWALLLELAGSDQERDLICYGVPPREDVDVAIELMRTGRRPRGGPLASSVIGSAA